MNPEKTGTISQADFDELEALPTKCVSQSVDLKIEAYVTGDDDKFYLERTWVSRCPEEEAPVQIERRECPNGSWFDHSHLYLESA